MKIVTLVVMLLAMTIAMCAYFMLPDPTRVILNCMSIAAGFGMGTLLVDVLHGHFK